MTGGDDGTRYAVSASHFGTEGAEVVEGEGDKGYDNTTGFARLSHTFHSGAEVGLLACALGAIPSLSAATPTMSSKCRRLR